MPVTLDEPITVGAVFSRSTVRPVWFVRPGREIRIREVAYSWKTREGNAGVLHFSVSDGQGLYEICYNTMTLGWRLLKAE